MEKRYFTCEEAQRALPRVKKSILELVKLSRAIDLLASIDVEFEDTHRALYSHITSRKEYHTLCAKFYKKMDALFAMGCIVKDLNRGLVDFYAKHNGRDIFLCWKFDEPRIQFWHEIHAGYIGRQPMNMLQAKH